MSGSLLGELAAADCWCGRSPEECEESGGCRWTRELARRGRAERARCVELARKVDATYPVTVGPAPGQVSVRHTAFPFGDYLEDLA
jgi:hypothetical protein